MNFDRKRAGRVIGMAGAFTSGEHSRMVCQARGPHTLLREDEYDEYTDVTCDSEIDWFDIMDPEHKKKAIGDYSSGREWVVCDPRKDSSIPGSQSADGSVKMLVVCTWSVPYRQLNTERAGQFSPMAQ
jgi:hypothetical protein